MEPVVHLRSAVSVLGRFPALAGVDLDVSAGEVVHLQGPNGAGKTTLLRVCAGLVGVVSGEAEVLGHDLRRHRRGVRPQVGFVGHDTFLYDDLTVVDNVRFWARAVGATTADADAALARLEVADRLADVAVRSLSAGQRRRTSFAAMLVRRPRLWLLDEPHAGLDQQGRDIVDELVLEAVQAGATVLVASHELERAGGLGGRTVTLVGGTVTDDGTGSGRAGNGRAGEGTTPGQVPVAGDRDDEGDPEHDAPEGPPAARRSRSGRGRELADAR